MKRLLFTLKFVSVVLVTACFFALPSVAQTAEWRLVFISYTNIDPDGGGGPASGSAQFKLQLHAQSGSFTAYTITTGFSYQSSLITLPIACTGIPPFPSNPSNIVLSSDFIAAGYSYNAVNECAVVPENTGGQAFDRRVNGTLANGNILISTAWVDVFTVTLWVNGITDPEGGYVMINSGEGGTPGLYDTYSISDGFGDPIPVNSLSYMTPIPLGGGTPTPVTFTDFNVTCADKGTLISWKTVTEENSSHFVIEKNSNGTWRSIDQVAAAGASSSNRSYQYLDLEGGFAQYRVKEVDLDGRFAYTSISYASCADKRVNAFIYPVPARDVLNVAIRTENAIRTNLEVFDMTGRMVARQFVNLNSGNNNVSVNVSQLTSGEYVIRSSDGSIQLNKKFTIVR